MMIRFWKCERSKPKLGLNQRRYLKVRAENNAIAEKAKEDVERTVDVWTRIANTRTVSSQKIKQKGWGTKEGNGMQHSLCRKQTKP